MLHVVVFAYGPSPSIISEVLHELGVFVRQIHTRHVRHKQVCDDDSQCAEYGSNDECPLLTEVGLDGSECCYADCCPSLAESSRNAEACPSNRCRVLLGTSE